MLLKITATILLLSGCLSGMGCRTSSELKGRLAELTAPRLARSAGGGYATTDTYLRALEIASPSLRVIAAVSPLPKEDAILFVAPNQNAETELTYRAIASLSWPHEVGALHCGLGGVNSGQPTLLFKPRAGQKVRWLLFYQLTPPAQSAIAAEIGPHLKLIAIEEVSRKEGGGINLFPGSAVPPACGPWPEDRLENKETSRHDTQAGGTALPGVSSHGTGKGFLLLAVALLLLLFAGLGGSLLLLPNKSRGDAAELFGLSFLLGSAVVSVLLFIFGLLLLGVYLRWTVAALCVLLGLAGLWRRGLPFKPHQLLPATATGWLLLAFSVIQVIAVALLCFWRVLGWDGLFNFESKARLALLNGGVIPHELFSDPSRTWMLQSYPLLLPLTESWLYLWLGRADQELIKIIFVLFFAAALCLLHGGAQRLGVEGWRRFIAPLLVSTTPLLLIGDGSASSGYADFPLAVFYLAAVVWLMEFWRSGDGKALQLAGVLLASACWLKQEGAILWLCVMGMVAAKSLFARAVRRDWRQLVMAALPGLLVIVGWQTFLWFANSAADAQFLPLGLSTLRANAWRLPQIAQAVFGEFTNWRHWGGFWLMTLAAFFYLLWRRERRMLILPLAVLLPVAIYSGVYVFSIWPSFLMHLQSSFPRLLIHVSLVTLLNISAGSSYLRIQRVRWRAKRLAK